MRYHCIYVHVQTSNPNKWDENLAKNERKECTQLGGSAEVVLLGAIITPCPQLGYHQRKKKL